MRVKRINMLYVVHVNRQTELRTGLGTCKQCMLPAIIFAVTHLWNPLLGRAGTRVRQERHPACKHLPKFSSSAPLLPHSRLAMLLASPKPRCLAVPGSGEEGLSLPTSHPSQAPLGILGQAQVPVDQPCSLMASGSALALGVPPPTLTLVVCVCGGALSKSNFGGP